MKPPPLCPVHEKPMIPTHTKDGRDHFHCSKCTIRIDRPASPEPATEITPP